MNNQTIIPPTFVLDEYYYSISAILTIGIQLACYAVAATCKFDLITDFAGSTNFVVLSVLTLVLGNNFGSRGIAITVLVLFTRLYLAFFLLFRVCKRKKDARFDEVRGNCIAFLVFWVFQMFWVFLCMMPVLYINSRGQQEDALTPLGYWDYVGWAIFAIGIIIQVTADYQKYFFRKNPENKGQFMATGVWGYSRHPNYFGEILIWWGAFLCAIPVIPFGQGTSGQIAAGIVTILSPLFTMFILILGSGIPQAEGKNLKRYYNAGHGEEWETYVKQTPPVVLLPNCLYLVLPGIVKGLCCCELDRYKYRANKESLTENPVTA